VKIINMTKVAGELVLVSSNLDKVDTSSSITLTFSSELVADSVKNNWSVTKSGSPVLVTASLGSDKKSITIKPQSGKWTKGSSYSVRGVAYSTEGAKASVSESFAPGSGAAAKAPDNVSDLAAKQDADDEDVVVLTWKAPKSNYSGYNLYYKTDDMNDYIFFDDFLATTTKISLELGTGFYADIETTGVKKISFILLPVSGGIEADVSKAKAAEYTIPEAKPVVVPSTDEDDEETP
jgi:hypothetical protein